MNDKIGQRPEVLENIRQNIAAAEKQRRELRFVYNLNDLLQGNIQILKNDEFAEGLSSYLFIDPPENKEQNIQLLIRVCEGVNVEDATIRERALALLSSATTFFMDRNEKESIVVLVQGICRWLKFETELVPGFAALNKKLEDVLLWLLNHAFWVEAEEVVDVLFRIQTGNLEKNQAIRSLTNKTLQNIQKKNIVEKLTDGYLLEDEQRPQFQNILHSMGHKAVIYLLNRVIHSQSKTERLTLLRLISTFGNLAVPALEDCLQKDPPWSVVRNIIFIVSEIGSDAHYALVARYFSHSDERIQHEMIRCVLKLGGKMMKHRLIKALGFVHSTLKIHILHLLSEQTDSDENVLEALLDLASNKVIFSSQTDVELQYAIIATLKAFPCEKSIAQLKKIRDEQTRGQSTVNLLFHIDEALNIIEPKVRHTLQVGGHFQDLVSFENDPVQQQLAYEKVRETEEAVQTLVRAGDMQQAEQLIYTQAIAAAKKKDFTEAGLLRDRLLEISPMALAEVIKLGEFIEEQKSTSITPHHLEIWSELYEEMTTEEFNELYYSLRQENYHKGDTIVRSGENDNSLYFLNSGYISLSCVVGGKEIFLKRMQPSNVIGGDQFFSPSVWTVTLKALGEVQVHVLDHAVLKKIAEEYPGIEDKLARYCRRYSQVPELLKMSGEDRREYPRYSVALFTRNILLDPYGNKGKRSFKGELLDISKQGLAFTIRISNADSARLLLGRHIMTTVIVADEELPTSYGVVVGVRLHEPIMQDFSVHVKLAKKIDDSSFKKILSLARRIQ
ncbi:MAG: cyclic nucleotide-binding domain-containing protein [Desulforhopalus sp.]